jgi:hypothetical protein
LIGHREINVEQVLDLLQEESVVQDYKHNHQTRNHKKTLKDNKFLVDIDMLN